MKFCLSNRQPPSVLDGADEIKVCSHDFSALSNYVQKYPEKTIIQVIDAENFNDIPFDYLNEHGVIAATANPKYVVNFAEKFYFDFPCFSWNTLDIIKEYKPEYILLAGELAFSLAAARNVINCKVRVIPNKILYPVKFRSPSPHQFTDFWIRPEDVPEYEKFVDVFEFQNSDLEKEKTFFKIYKTQNNWPGNLNFLIENLDINADNRGIVNDFGKVRVNCGQKCKKGSGCTFCEVALNLEKNLRHAHYMEDGLL